MKLEETQLQLLVMRDEMEQLQSERNANADLKPPIRWKSGPMIDLGASCQVSIGLNLQNGSFFACKQNLSMMGEDDIEEEVCVRE